MKKIDFIEKFQKNISINFSNILIIFLLSIGISSIILRKKSYLSLPNYSLSENSIQTLSKCSKILIVGNQYRPYLFTSSGIKVFSGSTPLTGTASPQVQVRWKIVGSSLTSENKIHGVSLQWK